MVSRARKYGQSCLTCRRRKVRCDGQRPICAGCAKFGERCAYNVHDSTVSRLRNALTQSEERHQGLQADLQRLLLVDSVQCQNELRQLLQRRQPTHSSDELDENSETHTNGLGTRLEDEISEHEAEHEREDGYGATSRFHAGEDDEPAFQRGFTNNHEPIDADFHRRWLASNARFQKSFEQIAYDGLINDNRVDPETAKILLRIYWTWQAPLHNCVYRRSFFRDMVMKGPYYSDFLLFVIYAHASRHVQRTDPKYETLQQGEPFLDQAKLLLLDEMKKDKPTIPTIQGLLILGGRQCAIGRNSEGWLFTGMAIRMIRDLGLHLPSRQRSGDIEPDDLETQKRLYLSAYTWDKSISLCLGRPPSLTQMPYPEHCLLDTSDDEEPWQPFYLGQLEEIYVPTPCYTSTTFLHFVKLATIVNSAYLNVFGAKARHVTLAKLQAIETKLEDFFNSLPRELRFEKDIAASSCPPPHICCLNILYHTMLILIYRPHFLTKRQTDPATFLHAQKVCTREATAVNLYFQAYGRCFAYKNQTYLLSYCVYTAATIEVKQVSDLDPEISQAAIKRLGTTLAMLEEEARQTPGIRRSVEIIKARLSKLQPLPGPEATPVPLGIDIPARADRNQPLDNAVQHLPLHQNLAPPHSAQVPVHNTLQAQTRVDYNESIQAAEFDASIWPLHDPTFDVWSSTSPDVSGGFVPDSLSWYTS